MTERDAIVFVVDDNPSIRSGLEGLLRAAGLHVQTFGSAEEFLCSRRPDVPACLVLDVKLPGVSGLDLQHELARLGIQIPIIFITAHADDGARTQALAAGAVDFLYKPFREEELLNAIDAALKHS